MGWWQRYLDWRHRHVAAVSPAPGGFRLSAHTESRTVRWEQILKVTAFKRDLFTTDLLCLLILLDDGMIELNEDMVGYPEVEAQLAHALTLADDWNMAVLFPAFETRATEIYAREPSWR